MKSAHALYQAALTSVRNMLIFAGLNTFLSTAGFVIIPPAREPRYFFFFLL